MAQTTSLVFNGGVIPSPTPGTSGSGKAKLLKIGEITVTEQEVQVTKKVICDPDSITAVAPFMEVLTSAKLAELVNGNNILVLDDGTIQYMMSDATIAVEDGTAVCTAVNFLGLSKENRAKVLYQCTRITDELTLQQVLEVGEPVETGFDLVKADPEDTEAGTLIDKLMVEDTVADDPDDTLLEIVPSEDSEGHPKVAINEDNLRNHVDSIYNSIDSIVETLVGMDFDSVPRTYLHSSLNQSAGDSVTTRTTIDTFAVDVLESECFEFEETTTIDDVPFGYVWIEPGTYLINSVVTLQWVGNPRGTFIAKVGSVMGENLDFSQEQEISRQSTKVVTIPNRMKLAVNVTYDAGTPVMGFWIQSMQVVKLAGGISQTNVSHNDTLVGRGSVADPLGVDKEKLAQSTLAGNLAPAFDPTRPSENPYLPNQWVVKDGLLYKVKNEHYGAWVAADFTRSSLFDFFTDGFFATPVTPYDVIANKYVNNAGELAYDSNFNVYVFEVKAGKYISFTAAPGGGYIEFTDEEFNIVGSVFKIRDWYYLDKYLFYKVPEGAAYIRVTSTTRGDKTPTLVSHFDGANEVKLFQKLKQLAINDEEFQNTFIAFKDVLLKSPASTIAPVTRKKKNLFSNDLVGNFAIVRSTGRLDPLDEIPVYKAAIIKVDAGNYTISGYGDFDQWCIGLWDKNFNRLAVKTDQMTDDPNTLITIPEGESWGTATKVNVSAPSDCYLIVNFHNWDTKWASAQFQVEAGTDATAFVKGLKLLPYYATIKELKDLETKKKLSGKKLLVIGDSLTAQNITTSALENNFGCYIYNRGVSGTCVAKRSGSTLSFCQRFDLAENNNKGPNANGFPNRSNIDAVIVWGGINDWGNSLPIGAIDGTVDKETLFGAYKYLIEGLKTRYHGKPIIICSVHNAARSTRFTNWNRATFNNDGSFTFRTNSQNKMLSDYHDAQKAICDIFGVLFVDMFECGVSFMSEYDLEHYSYVQGDPAAPDGLHLNYTGGEIVARYLSSIIANAL